MSCSAFITKVNNFNSILLDLLLKERICSKILSIKRSPSLPPDKGGKYQTNVYFPFISKELHSYVPSKTLVYFYTFFRGLYDQKQYFNVINQVISYWPSYGCKVYCIGQRPRANTADRRPVTGPIRNYLINDNFFN